MGRGQFKADVSVTLSLCKSSSVVFSEYGPHSIGVFTRQRSFTQISHKLVRATAVIHYWRAERWPSGRRRLTRNQVYGNVSRVRIPASPPPAQLSKIAPTNGFFLSVIRRLYP